MFYYKLFTNKKNILNFIYIYHYFHFFQKWTCSTSKINGSINSSNDTNNSLFNTIFPNKEEHVTTKEHFVSWPLLQRKSSKIIESSRPSTILLNFDESLKPPHCERAYRPLQQFPPRRSKNIIFHIDRQKRERLCLHPLGSPEGEE